jgi:hypothetical protein
MKRGSLPFAAGVMCVTLASAHASASVLLFTDEQEFLAATGALAFEGFEDTAAGTTGSSRILDGFILGPLFGNEDDPGDTFENLEIFNDPAVAYEGSQSVGGFVRNIGFFAFAEAPTAIGFTVFDFGNAGDSDLLRLILSDLDGVFATIPLASSDDPFAPFRFFGVISSRPFDTVQIRKGVAADFITVDAVYFGHAVPEPPVIALIGVVAAWRARRRWSRRTRRHT